MQKFRQDTLAWKLRPLVFVHVIALLLMTSWLFEPFKSIWMDLDRELFWFFNHSLKEGSDFYRNFWAMANMKNFDRVIGLLLLSFFGVHAINNGKAFWGRHLGILTALFIALGIWTGFGTLTGLAHLMPLERLSATLEYADSFRLTQWSELNTKDASVDSFPGDHGMILLISAGFIAYYFSTKYIVLAFVVVFIGTLPRVVVGAHWLTDEIVGAIFIALLALSWNFHTPLGEFIVRSTDTISRKIFRLDQKPL